jgi:hypothetical protein
MRNARVFLARFVLLCFLVVPVTDVLAKRPAYDSGGGDSCLSNKELNALAKQVLPELQSIDPSVTLSDVKSVINSVGDCATTNAVSIALEAYADELRTGSDTGETVDHTPIAVSDSVTTTVNTPVTIDVLANDTGLEDSPVTVTVAGTPANGSVVLQSNTLTYSPNDNFGGEDTMTYAIKDADGDLATAMVAVTVDCGGCTPTNPTIALSWTPPAGDVTGYRVYFGTAPDNAIQRVADVVTPSIDLNASDDLSLVSGDPMCFRVKAYNGVGESDFSEAACGIL